MGGRRELYLYLSRPHALLFTKGTATSMPTFVRSFASLKAMTWDEVTAPVRGDIDGRG